MPPPRSVVRGFTLSEVLITLGIVGIVATITIPTIISKYKHAETTTRLKKFHSTMQQMILKAREEHGEVNTWNRNVPHEQFLRTYFAPYLEHIQLKDDTIIFKDSTILTIKNYNPGCVDMVYDTNGNRKPNKEGYDKYRFLICPKETPEWCGNIGYCTYRQEAYKNNRSRLLYCCKYQTCGAGLTCSSLLEYDNWEFKKDYPHKF